MPKKPGGDKQPQEYSEKTGKYVAESDSLLSEFETFDLGLDDDSFASLLAKDELFQEKEDFGLDDSMFEMTQKEEEIEKIIEEAKSSSLSLKHLQENRKDRIINYTDNKYYGINYCNQELMTEFNAKLRDALNDSVIGKKVSVSDLLNIIDSGKIMNQFESFHSGGLYNPNKRLQASKKLFGTEISNLSKEQTYTLEKYGMLAPRDNIEKSYQNGGMQYGEVFLIFNDALKEVTSYSIGDSLDNEYTGISPKMFNEAPDIFTLPSDTRVGLSGTSAKGNKKIKLLKDIVDFTMGGVGFSYESYVEAQFHIPNMTTSCIEAIYIPYDKAYKITDSAKKILQKGLDIKYITTVNGTQRYMQYNEIKDDFDLI